MALLLLLAAPAPHGGHFIPPAPDPGTPVRVEFLLAAMSADGVVGLPEETRVVDARNLDRILEGQKNALAGALVGVAAFPEGHPGTPNRLIATRDSQGRYAMVYVPRKGRTFTIATSSLSGTEVKVWWYDCRNGKSFSAGKFAPGGFRTFTTPDYGQDWVLVLDDTAQGFSRPGVGGPRGGPGRGRADWAVGR